MAIDQELHLMVQSVLERTGERARTIVCSRDVFEQIRTQSAMFYTSDSDVSNSQCVGRYAGIPVQVSDHIEPGKVYVIPEYKDTSQDTTYVARGWDMPYYPYAYGMELCVGYNPQYEEANDIDEGSFMDILSCQNP